MSTGRGWEAGDRLGPDRCLCPGRCGACPGHRGPIAVLHPVPGSRPPGPALDLTPALPVAGGWAPLPQGRFQTLPHSQASQAPGAAPGHDPPAGPPQSRAGAGSSALEGEEGAARVSRAMGGAAARCPEASPDGALSLSGPSLAAGSAARRDCHGSASPCAGIAVPWLCPGECPLCPTAITSCRAFPRGPPAPGAQGPPSPAWGSSSDGGIRRCRVLLQQGHADLSSGKTPSSVPSVWF